MQNIVIIEDSATTTLYYQLLLKDIYNCHTAITGKDGVELVKNTKPTCVITDIQLPDTTGDVIVEELRKFYSGILLVISSSGQSVLIEKALENGACDFLKKPVSRNTLLEKMGHCKQCKGQGHCK